MSTTPPGLWHDPPNYNFDCTDDTLHVPAGCVAVYRAAADWRNVFTNIVEQ
jgi:hypothetical protein